METHLDVAELLGRGSGNQRGHQDGRLLQLLLVELAGVEGDEVRASELLQGRVREPPGSPLHLLLHFTVHCRLQGLGEAGHLPHCGEGSVGPVAQQLRPEEYYVSRYTLTP